MAHEANRRLNSSVSFGYSDKKPARPPGPRELRTAAPQPRRPRSRPPRPAETSSSEQVLPPPQGSATTDGATLPARWEGSSPTYPGAGARAELATRLTAASFRPGGGFCPSESGPSGRTSPASPQPRPPRGAPFLASTLSLPQQ